VSGERAVFGFVCAKVCQADRTKRLGCVKNGVAGIKKHKFYKGLDWKAIAARTENGPIPIALGGAGDTSQFENYPVVPDEPLPATDPFKAIFANW
jgi:protein kinase A